jgi:hypothetical protein
MPEPTQVLRAAKLAHAIADAGDYDSDAVSRIFEQSDESVKTILADKGYVFSPIAHKDSETKCKSEEGKRCP